MYTMEHKKRVETGKAGGGPRNLEPEGGLEGEIEVLTGGTQYKCACPGRLFRAVAGLHRHFILIFHFHWKG